MIASQKSFDALTSVSTLHPVWVSKASAIQRKGRWGVRVIVIKDAVVRATNSRNSVRDRYCVLRAAYWSKLLRKLFQCYCLSQLEQIAATWKKEIYCASSKVGNVFLDSWRNNVA